MEQILSLSPQEQPTLLTPWSQTSSLQKVRQHISVVLANQFAVCCQSRLSELIHSPSTLHPSTEGPASPEPPSRACIDHFPRPILLRTECDENKFPLSLTGGPEQLCVWHLYASSHMRGFMWLRSWRWEGKGCRPGGWGQPSSTSTIQQRIQGFQNSKCEPCLPGKDEDTFVKIRS